MTISGDDRANAHPPVATMHLWGVATRRIPSALNRMASTRRVLSQTPGLEFFKLLGTGNGQTFTARDADPHHWGLLAVWRDHQAAQQVPTHPAFASWNDIAAECLTVRLRPLASHGKWAGREPFGQPEPMQAVGPVASLTRARISATKAMRFWRAVPAVSLAARHAPGLRLAVGIGEAPIGLQGTFSLWDDAASLRDFAHRGAAHREVMARTRDEKWYSEELFARFAVTEVTGTYQGGTPWPTSP